ncbi:MAG: SHOCT domain-containing protein [Acidimicrobiales bacterium]
MPLLDFFFSLLWIFLWIAWIWLVISIFIDIFRSEDLSGWGKALWSLFVLFLPFLGVFVYLIARGGSMQERRIDDYKQQQAATDAYIRSAAGGTDGVADELAKLGQLKDQGALTQAEYDNQKAKLLA